MGVRVRLQRCLSKSHISAVFKVFIECTLLLESGKKSIGLLFCFDKAHIPEPTIRVLCPLTLALW